MVNALKRDCFPLFSRRFSVTKQCVNWCLREFSLIYLMFTARLTHGIQIVFQCFLVFPSYKTTHSLEFSVTFLAFSRTVNARKRPENCLFFSVHQLVNTYKPWCFLWRKPRCCHVYTYFRAFSVFTASRFRWYLTCTLKSVGWRCFQILLQLCFRSLWVRSCAATFKMIFKRFNIVDRRTWFPPWLCPQQWNIRYKYIFPHCFIINDSNRYLANSITEWLKHLFILYTNW